MISGIFGVITKRPYDYAAPELARMASAMKREGLVAETSIDEMMGAYLGYVCGQGTSLPSTPARARRGDIGIALVGELFPGSDDQGVGISQPHTGSAGGSALIDLYRKHPSFPAMLNGRFHGLLKDSDDGTLVLFNDRLGMRRVYYHESHDSFYFSSEAKAILAARPDLQRIRPQSLADFIHCSAVLEGKTLFEGIELLPPASKWLFRNGKLELKQSYFSLAEWENQETLEPESYYRELQQTFTRILPRYFEGSERVGMSLTGGLDTRMIVAGYGPEAASVPCYTFGSMYRDNHDVRIARRVAKEWGQTHQVITAGTEFLAKFPEYLDRTIYLTDGCVDASRAPDLYLNEQARHVAPIRLTGNFGGEILRQVVSFKPSGLLDGLFAPELTPLFTQSAEAYSRNKAGHPVSFAAFRQAPWYMHGVLALEETQLTMRSPFLDHELLRTVYRAPGSTLTSSDTSLRLIADGNPRMTMIPTDRGLAGKSIGSTKFYKRALLEASFKAEYLFDMGMPQWVAWANQWLTPIRFEDLILGRHKPFHFRVWYRNQLAGYLKEMLLDSKSLTRPYIEKRTVQKLVLGHLRGDRNYTNEIHKLLALEIIHRKFVDGNRHSPDIEFSPEPRISAPQGIRYA